MMRLVRLVGKLVDYVLTPWRRVPLRADEIQEVRTRYADANQALQRLIDSGAIRVRQSDQHELHRSRAALHAAHRSHQP